MSSPITLSGFNQIDFSLILNAIMQQERQPVTALEAQKRALEAQRTGYGTLASRLAGLESAAEDLVRPGAFDATAATASDASRLAVSAGADAASGTYEIYVDALARAQVTTSVQAYADKDATLVAGAGTLRFTTASGSVDVALTGDVTLEQLADAINATDGVPVSASIVRTAGGQFQLMLTGRATGAENAFTVDTTGLTGPSTAPGTIMTFGQAQAAQDASIRINGVTATSSGNTFEGVINGLSFTALRQDEDTAVTVTITADEDSVVNLVQKLIAAFNDTTDWIGEQTAAAARSDDNSIGRDPLARTLRSQLTGITTAGYGGTPGYTALAEIGFEFTRSGELTLNESAFRAALADGRTDVATLFRGSDGTGGAVGSLVAAINEYTKAGGLVPNAQNRVTNQLSQLSDRIGAMEERLATRRLVLQREFAAADAALAQLNAQRDSLSSLGQQFSLF
jgi:flagellar hook-associated protein 2